MPSVTQGTQEGQVRRRGHHVLLTGTGSGVLVGRGHPYVAEAQGRILGGGTKVRRRLEKKEKKINVTFKLIELCLIQYIPTSGLMLHLCASSRVLKDNTLHNTTLMMLSASALAQAVSFYGKMIFSTFNLLTRENSSFQTECKESQLFFPLVIVIHSLLF